MKFFVTLLFALSLTVSAAGQGVGKKTILARPTVLFMVTAIGWEHFSTIRSAYLQQWTKSYRLE